MLWVSCKFITISSLPHCITQEQIRSQPMSATDARHLLQEIRDAEDMVEKNRQMKNEKSQRIGELQMVHNKSVCVCGVSGVCGVCVTLYVCVGVCDACVCNVVCVCEVLHKLVWHKTPSCNHYHLHPHPQECDLVR